jgi:hypothetical protein
LKTCVTIVMRVTIQVRQIKKVQLCQQKITLNLYFWVVNCDLFFNNFFSALKCIARLPWQYTLKTSIIEYQTAAHHFLHKNFFFKLQVSGSWPCVCNLVCMYQNFAARWRVHWNTYLDYNGSISTYSSKKNPLTTFHQILEYNQ